MTHGEVLGYGEAFTEAMRTAVSGSAIQHRPSSDSCTDIDRDLPRSHSETETTETGLEHKGHSQPPPFPTTTLAEWLNLIQKLKLRPHWHRELGHLQVTLDKSVVSMAITENEGIT